MPPNRADTKSRRWMLAKFFITSLPPRPATQQNIRRSRNRKVPHAYRRPGPAADIVARSQLMVCILKLGPSGYAAHVGAQDEFTRSILGSSVTANQVSKVSEAAADQSGITGSGLSL